MASSSSVWKDEEVYKLIELWGDDVIQSQLEGCKHNREVYEKISKSMKEAGFNKTSDQCRDKAKKLKADYRKTKDKNKQTGNKRKTCKYGEALAEVLAHRPATKPPLVIDTSCEGIYDTDGEGTTGNGCNGRPVDVPVDGTETSDDTASIAATDVSSVPADVSSVPADESSEGKAKVEIKTAKKVPKKRGREDRLQTIMGGIVTQIIDSQLQSDERYLELEEKRIRLEQENKKREERMRKDEMDFQLRMMSMLVQSQSSGYPFPTPYNGSFYGHDSHDQ